MLKFKKEFENHSIALADGTLINEISIGSDYAQEKLKSISAFAYMFESDAAEDLKAENLKAKTPKKTST
jgi:hypothetical protein